MEPKEPKATSDRGVQDPKLEADNAKRHERNKGITTNVAKCIATATSSFLLLVAMQTLLVKITRVWIYRELR